MFATMIKQNTENRDVSKAGLQVNKEKYIDDLLLFLRSDKSLRKRAHLKKWQVVLLTLLFDLKKQEVPPGSVVACTVPEFISSLFWYAKQRPEMNELLKKHCLYDDENKDDDYRLAAREAACDTITDTLIQFSNLSKFNDGITYYEDTIILYRDQLPEPQDQDSQAEYNSVEEDKKWLINDFDWEIEEFIEKNTEAYTTVLSEEDFFNRFKGYVESTLLSETVPHDIRVDENRKIMLVKLVSSIDYFYKSLYLRDKLKEVCCPLTWSMHEGYVVLTNGNLTEYDHRLDLV